MTGQPLLTFGRVDQVRIQVGYRVTPDGPAYEQFLLDLAVPGETLFDEQRLLTALEPVLYAGEGPARHYSLHAHRWHTSWGASPGVVELGLLVTTGRRSAALSDNVTAPFRELLNMFESPAPTPVSRDAAVVRATSAAALAYGLDPDALTLSVEEHHVSTNSWSLGLRTPRGDEYDVVVGFLDGYAGSVQVRHLDPIEVSDSVGTE
jgi:hypothetical protein